MLTKHFHQVTSFKSEKIEQLLFTSKVEQSSLPSKTTQDLQLEYNQLDELPLETRVSRYVRYMSSETYRQKYVVSIQCVVTRLL